MTLLNTIGIVLVACLVVGAMVWAIHSADARAERRIRNRTAEALAKPDDAYVASVIRYRALDDEYRKLVLDEHNKDNA
jgi:hypothetical protein